MAEPTKKSPELENFLEKTFGRTTAIKQGKCVSCHRAATSFKDGLSHHEYRISGLCQKCQDEVFDK